MIFVEPHHLLKPFRALVFWKGNTLNNLHKTTTLVEEEYFSLCLQLMRRNVILVNPSVAVDKVP